MSRAEVFQVGRTIKRVPPNLHSRLQGVGLLLENP
jgi:hypothetical protein